MAEARRLIPADWVLKRIQEGKNVRLENATIKGDLDLNKLDLPIQHLDRTKSQKQMVLKEDVKIVQSRIDITNSKILGTLDFCDAIFDVVSFLGTTFGDTFGLNEANFSGTTFRLANFKGTIFEGDANFRVTTFLWAFFNGATFTGNTDFSGATFNRNADFIKASFNRSAKFIEATINGRADFGEANFRDYSRFEGVFFHKYAFFNKVVFHGDAIFNKVTFGQEARFGGAEFYCHARFEGAIFNGYTEFEGTAFAGKYVTFKKAKFEIEYQQEDSCRMAKKLLEEIGDRDESDENFYLEMDAKRRRKQWLWRNLELIFIQWIFGYGVHPIRLVFCWFVMVTIFAIGYWNMQGIQTKFLVSSLPAIINGKVDLTTYKHIVYFIESLYFSVITALTPGYGKYELTSWMPQIAATIEAILGTFMWAAFIATFSRKFLR